MKISDTKELGRFIKAERKNQGLTQADLAAAVNAGIRFISELENGKRTSQTGKVFDVCNALGIKIELAAGV